MILRLQNERVPENEWVPDQIGLNPISLFSNSPLNLVHELFKPWLMNYLNRGNILSILLFFIALKVSAQHALIKTDSADDPARVFVDPPASAKPGVLWMWMGSNVSQEGIRKDLEALQKEGFSSTTMLSLADVTTPWACNIDKSPT